MPTGDDTSSDAPEKTENPVTTLVAAPPPLRPLDDLGPDELEMYVRGSMHQDRKPGNLLIVCHPLRLYKVPRNLFESLEHAGFNVKIVETHPNRVTSVTGIRDAFLAHSSPGVPLDLMVLSGDGSLDHHVLVAAYWAFYPELVTYREGSISCEAPSSAELARIPNIYRRTFVEPLPDVTHLQPKDDTIREIWLLRDALKSALLKQKSMTRLTRIAERHLQDPLFRVAVMAALFPDRVTLRPHGFDLSGLATATQEQAFQGLYGYIRSIAAYPAGTASDNALYAGVPGWVYSQISRFLQAPMLEGMRTWLERRVTNRFLNFYLRESVVVPARCSLIAFDGDWQVISSHAAGGPGSGHFFSADLSSKTRGMWGYLARIPKVVIQEGLFGSTIVRIKTTAADGRIKSLVEDQIAEGLYTNRAFIAGVGSVPSTNPTSFAGQSSLIIVPPIWYRDKNGRRRINLRGLGCMIEAILKGATGRVLHICGMDPGSLAGGGQFTLAAPENQITVKEGEEIDISYLHRHGGHRFVAVQVSGDPFQARQMTIRTAWGPLPMLANTNSLLLSSAKRSLADLRIEQTFRLKRVYIGGLHYFCHRTGQSWSASFCQQTGLFAPPHHLPRRLVKAQRRLLERWSKMGTGDFVDTSERGWKLKRRGRYAHNNDQSAHLVLLREHRRVLLVRQVRSGVDCDRIYETLTRYRAFGPYYVIHDSQTRCWASGENPEILQEAYYFRSADEYRQEAPSFFPFVEDSAKELFLAELTDEAWFEQIEVPNESKPRR